MTYHQHFLGWDGPLLPRAAAWLSRQQVDLVVVPTTRAGRRLRECLAERVAPDATWLPPRIVSASQLLDLIAPGQSQSQAQRETGDVPHFDNNTVFNHLQPASRTLFRLHTSSVLQSHEADNDSADPNMGSGTCAAWYRSAAIADAIETVHSKGLRVADAIALLELDSERHQQLAAWEMAIEQSLMSAGYCSRLSFRTEGSDGTRSVTAMNRKAEQKAHAQRTPRPMDQGVIALVACPEVIPHLAQLLPHYPNDTHALIMAPEEHSAGFTEHGLIDPDYWSGRPAPIADQDIWPLAHSDYQADAALRVMAEAGTTDNPLYPDECAIILPDETDIPQLRRGLRQAKVPHRYGPGQAFAEHSIGRLLTALTNLHRRPQTAELIALLRHPRWRKLSGDAVGLVIEEHRKAPSRNLRQLSVSCAITQRLLDRLHLTDGPEVECTQPLAQWIPQIQQQFIEVMPEKLSPYHADSEALSCLAQGLSELEQCPESITGSLADAYEILSDIVKPLTIPESGQHAAVELLGPLEAMCEEASWLVVTQMTEGSMPNTIDADAYWPNSLRQRLGLIDNQHRLGRDNYILHSVIAARPAGRCRFLVPRVSNDDSPTMPSRLLLLGEERHRRTRGLFGDASDQHIAQLSSPELISYEHLSRTSHPEETSIADQLTWAPASPDSTVLSAAAGDVTRINVTALRTYLACPYRFYLGHVLRLRPQQTADAEWAANDFGNLMHHVLQSWGQSTAKDSQNPQDIYQYLRDQLYQDVQQIIGQQPSLAIRLQVHEAEQRLKQFAQSQAACRGEGWRIISCEEKITLPIHIADKQIELVGTIDRIDQHPELGKRLIDYKTSDNAKRPWNQHIKQGQWVDLQLPAYQRMTGIDCCGYWNLPSEPVLSGWQPFEPPTRKKKTSKKKTSTTTPQSAEAAAIDEIPWPEGLTTASEALEATLTAIAQQQFWPPGPPALFDDGWSALLADRDPDRALRWQPEGTEHQEIDNQRTAKTEIMQGKSEENV